MKIQIHCSVSDLVSTLSEHRFNEPFLVIVTFFLLIVPQHLLRIFEIVPKFQFLRFLTFSTFLDEKAQFEVTEVSLQVISPKT